VPDAPRTGRRAAPAAAADPRLGATPTPNASPTPRATPAPAWNPQRHPDAPHPGDAGPRRTADGERPESARPPQPDRASHGARPAPRDYGAPAGSPPPGQPVRPPQQRGSAQPGRPESQGRPDLQARPDQRNRPDPQGRPDSHGRPGSQGRPDGQGRPDSQGHPDRRDPRGQTRGPQSHPGRPEHQGPPARGHDAGRAPIDPRAQSDRADQLGRPGQRRPAPDDRRAASLPDRPTVPRDRIRPDDRPGSARDLRAESADDFAALLAAAAGHDVAAPAGLEFREVEPKPSKPSRTTWSGRRSAAGSDRAARGASASGTRSGSRGPGAEQPAGSATSASKPTASKPTATRSLRRAVSTRVVSTVAMGFAAMLAVATSVPSLSLLSPADVQAMAMSNTTIAIIDGQRVEIAAGALAASIDHEGYQHQTIEEYARAAGIRPEATFTNNPLGTIQWPFAVGVHIGDRFGYRNCAGCSSNHHGQDFNPGLGAQIQSIADGTVSASTDAGGSLGVVTMVDHVIDGQVITSVYAHMEYDSRRFEVGDTVKVGDVLGTTGNTGMSTGPHLHFEIRIGGIDGEWVDPLEWLYANTN
jgi:murein DD-endopeptidase MepM/ murein hydrolase activator NlpD